MPAFNLAEYVFTEADRARFVSKLSGMDQPSGCWEWTASRRPKGYGQFRVNRQTPLAHRVAWCLFRGPILNSLCVLHRCDNPPCCNPSHLFLGTVAMNNADMKAKGRRCDGERHPTTKLKADEVLEIRRRRAQGETHTSISKDYPISRQQVSKILARKRWEHI